MNGLDALTNRKTEHMRIAINENVFSRLTNGFEKYHFVHQALPEINLSEIDIRSTVFNKKLLAPLLISSMVGGTEEAARINKTLAYVAQTAGIAMGVGSQRIGLEHPEKMKTFQVRDVAANILLFANLGAVQLNYSYTLDHCRRAVEAIEADALVLHINPLQEALQPEGNTNFFGLLNKIEEVCKSIQVPVVVKEVGWGMSKQVAKKLESAGVAAIDVAGAGGTSWSEVEKHRIKDHNRINVADNFKDWGIPTAESINLVKDATKNMMIFASGGIRNGIEVAKSIALGASIAGMATNFIKAASISLEETVKVANEVIQQLRICMFVIGAKDLSDLKKTALIHE